MPCEPRRSLHSSRKGHCLWSMPREPRRSLHSSGKDTAYGRCRVSPDDRDDKAFTVTADTSASEREPPRRFRVNKSNVIDTGLDRRARIVPSLVQERAMPMADATIDLLKDHFRQLRLPTMGQE